VVYEVSSAIAQPTTRSNQCSYGSSNDCPNNMGTTSLTIFPNSFLVTTGGVCRDVDTGNNLQITAGPGSFVSDYGPSKREYVGHQLPGSSGSQSFQMTNSGSPQCWSVVGAQFVDPPPPLGWNPGVGQASQSSSNDFRLLPSMPSPQGTLAIGAILSLALVVTLVLAGITRYHSSSREGKRRAN
jgi:hypothetical protein